MNISERGISFIRSFEKFSPESYPDQGGRLTIGFGHLIKPDESFLSPITQDQATILLAGDLGAAEGCLNDRVAISLAQNQFDALVSLIFNIGVGAFANSTLLRLLNAQNMTAASQQFTRWDRVAGQVSEGLVTRRQAEHLMFTDGVYQNHT